MVPLTIRVHNELPRVGTVDLNYWGKAKDSAETVGQKRVGIATSLGCVTKARFTAMTLKTDQT